MEIPYAGAMHPGSPDTLVFRQNSRRLWSGIVLVMVTAGIGIVATGLSVDLRSGSGLGELPGELENLRSTLLLWEKLSRGKCLYAMMPYEPAFE